MTILGHAGPQGAQQITSGIRADFLTLPQAHSLLAKDPSWRRHLKGDLEMHTQWSDGSGSIEQMAEAGEARGYIKAHPEFEDIGESHAAGMV